MRNDQYYLMKVLQYFEDEEAVGVIQNYDGLVSTQVDALIGYRIQETNDGS